MTEDMDARARVKRLEAECERLREQAEEMAKRQAITQYWLDRANSTISAMSLEQAFATPPPEGEPCDTCGGARKIAVDTTCPDCQGRGLKDAPQTTEQTGERQMVMRIDKAPRCYWHINCSHHFGGILKEAGPHENGRTLFKCLSCGDHGYIHQGQAFGVPFSAPVAKQETEPDQTGDALAAFERLLPMDDLTAPYGLPPNVDVDAWNRDREVLRRHLTASGVPEDGFGVEDVVRWASWIVGTEGAAGCPTPSDRVASIAHAVVNADQGEDDSDPLADSGVPYVPEEVRRLPDKWDSEVDGPEVESHWRDAVGGCIDDLKDALASAPAVPRIPVEVAKRVIAVRDAMIEGDDMEAWHQLYRIADPDCTQSKPWAELERIAAAPTDGRG